MRKQFALVSMLLLAGCTHTMDITSQQTGAIAHLSFVEGEGNGDVDFSLNGKPYHGTWVYAPYNEGLWFGTEAEANATGVGTPRGAITPTGGNGDFVATTPGGPNLDCLFTISEWNGRGFGQCHDAEGAAYDLQIH
jgi:hypothetical protein